MALGIPTRLLSHSGLLGTYMVVSAIPSILEANPLVCTEEFYKPPSREVAAFDLEAQELTDSIVQSLGLRRKITAIPCTWLPVAAQAWTMEGSQIRTVPEGDYIIYNPSRVQMIIGSERALAVALFAHEVAHILNSDFTSSRTELGIKKVEGDADYFAGCMVARLQFRLEDVNRLIHRVRDENDVSYPGKLESLQLVNEGYTKCSRFVSPEGVNEAVATDISIKLIQLYADNKIEEIFNSLLSEHAKAGFPIELLKSIAMDFKDAHSFGDLLSTKRIGFSSFADPPGYPPGTYASTVLKVETTSGNFSSTVILGWQDTEWRVYSFTFYPLPGTAEHTLDRGPTLSDVK